MPIMIINIVIIVVSKNQILYKFKYDLTANELNHVKVTMIQINNKIHHKVNER